MINPLYPGLAGLRRQVKFDPAPDRIRAEVEDDFHNFVVTLVHKAGRITAVETQSLRHPWTACPAAGGFLASRLAGIALNDVATTPSPLSHCTHMLDLAIVAAAHARDGSSGRFDMFVGDADGLRRTAELWRDGNLILAWQLDGDLIVTGPAEGRHLRQLRQWLPHEPVWLQEPARLLRRAVSIFGGRHYDYEHLTVAAETPGQQGACFTYQPERAASALPMRGSKRDFTYSAAGEPVEGTASHHGSDQ